MQNIIGVFIGGLITAARKIAVNLMSQLKFRAIADGGTFEAMQCGIDIVDDLVVTELLDSTSLIITPNAYKSGRLYAAKPGTYGAELVVNGDFATDSDWAKGTGWTISSGKAHCDGTQVTNADLTQSSVTTSGKVYKITYTVSNYSAGNCFPRVGSGFVGASRSSNGTFTDIIEVGSSTLNIRGDVNFIGSIDNVSIKEDLTGDLTWTGGAGTRVNSEGNVEVASVLGEDVVVNGDFATDTDWTKSAQVTISGGTGNIISNDGSFQNITQLILTIGVTYLITFDIVNVNSGAIKVGSGGGGDDIATNISTVGSYSITFTSIGTSIAFARYFGVTDISIDNVVVKEVITTDIPRIDYPLDGSCPHVLMEPQRTNLITYSEDFDDAAWALGANEVITANNSVSPDGTVSADTLGDDNSTGTGSVYKGRTVTVATTTSYVYSVYAKAKQLSIVNLRIEGFTTPGSTDGYFNLSTGALGTIDVGYDDAGIDDMGNGWYRCWASFTTDAVDTTGNILLFLAQTDNSLTVDLDGTSDIYLYGAQLEAGAYPTSYIPTSGSTVTRLKDTYELTNVYTNNLVTASGGAWFIELVDNVELVRDVIGTDLWLGTVNTNSTGDSFSFRNSGATIQRVALKKTISSVESTLYTTTTDDCKLLINWNGTTVDVWENGVKVVSASVFTNTALEYFEATANSRSNKFKQNLLFPAPLTDDQIQELMGYDSYTEMAATEGYNLILDI